MKDFFYAIRDVFFKIEVDEKPVTKYQTELKTGLFASVQKKKKRVEQLKLRIDDYESQRSDVLKRNLRAAEKETNRKIFILEAEEKIAKSKIEKYKARLEEKYSSIEDARRELETSTESYNRWREALGRPTYTEKYEDLVNTIRKDSKFANETLNDQREIIEQQEKTSWFKRNLSSIIAAIAAFLIVPLDVVYIAPGFELLLESPGLGLASATLYVIILAALGRMITWLYRSSFTRVCTRVFENTENSNSRTSSRRNKVIVATTTNRLLLSLLILAAIVTSAVIYGGATIRSFVPQLSELSDKLEGANQSLNSAPRLLINGSITKDDFNERVKEAEKVRTEVAVEKSDIKERFLPTSSADAVLAFAIYTAIALTTFLAGLTRTDPIFEYFLAHRDRSLARARLIFLENIATAQLQALEDSLEGVQVELMKLKVETTVEDDLKSVDNVRSIDSTIETMKAEISSTEGVISAEENEAKEATRIRSLRYAKSLSLLKRNRKPIKEWEELSVDPEFN